MRFLFLAFILVPIIEMVVLIEVGSIVGVFNTILLVLLTAIIGVTLLKKQGLETFLNANQKMQTGQMPVSEMAQGLMLAVAGALLLTPGFVTDTIGFLLLTPAIRYWLAKKLFATLVSQGNVYFQQSTEYHYRDPRTGEEHDVIEGEFRELSSKKDPADK